MKKTFLVLVALIMSCYAFSQEKFVITGGTKGNQYYVGSLPISYVGSHHKLKIEIFGGGYISTTLGTKRYSISTRDGLRILRSQEGGNTGQYILKVYKNETNYDFVIEAIWDYSSLIIKTWLTPNNTGNEIKNLQTVEIRTYDSTGKEEVTNQFTQVLLPSSDAYGKFGIGTDNPQSMLDVRGKIIADEVEIKVNKGADFVFSPDYNLKPLSEVESFVKDNKHLPDIPSEKEMKENGLNINDMQIKLLQKIEELTLYVIEQDKKYDDLNKKYEGVKQELKELKKE